MLGTLPVGTELYKFKLGEFKALSNTRKEIAKIVSE
jgi:hypothetical protein